MNGWFIASSALVVVIGWMAVIFRCAPLGIEDEGGFHFIWPDDGTGSYASAACADQLSWPTVTMLVMPLWPL